MSMHKELISASSFRRFRWVLAYQAVVYGVGIVITAGLVPQWGHWYSQNTHHRTQVDSLLSGSLALSHEPWSLTYDICWSQGGVHQVWGLGIPLWRVPLEALARVFGAGGFPDRLALALALALAAWVVLWGLSEVLLLEPLNPSAPSPQPSPPMGESEEPIGTGRCMESENLTSLTRVGTVNRSAPSPQPSPPMGEREEPIGTGRVMGRDGVEKTNGSLLRVAWLAGAAALLLLFPPFLNLLQARFEIYEEVIAYEYLVGLGLISGLLAVATWRSRRAYLLLCLVAGLGGLFRPTLVVHGAAAVLAGAVALGWKKGNGSNVLLARKFALPGGSGSVEQLESDLNSPAGKPALRWGRTVAVGVGLFVLGGGLLFFTNHVRFGSGFEFGHRLNVQTLYGSLYATRFDDPYQDEPLLSAGRELFGLLFLARDFKLGDYYREHVFAGQSPTVRWREVYLTTYDPSYLAWLAAGLAAGALAWWRQWKFICASAPTLHRFNASSLPVGTLALYGAVASSLLLGLYWRNPVISSRYLLDLMPSFAALILAGWLAWGWFWQDREWEGWVLAFSALVLGVWLGWEMNHSDRTYRPPGALTWEEVMARRSHAAPQMGLPPAGVYATPAAPAKTGIPYNGAGWAGPSGMVMPCVILFVDAPAFLECEMAGFPEVTSGAGPVALRAKVGLEYLQRQSMVRSEHGWVVRFAGPQRRRYQKGLQPVFLATVSKEHLADEKTPWRLLKVRWKDMERNK